MHLSGVLDQFSDINIYFNDANSPKRKFQIGQN